MKRADILVGSRNTQTANKNILLVHSCVTGRQDFDLCPHADFETRTFRMPQKSNPARTTHEDHLLDVQYNPEIPASKLALGIGLKTCI